MWNPLPLIRYFLNRHKVLTISWFATGSVAATLFFVAFVLVRLSAQGVEELEKQFAGTSGPVVQEQFQYILKNLRTVALLWAGVFVGAWALVAWNFYGLKKSREAMEEANKVLEIKVLARTRELRELTAGLEGKVRKRTEELEEKVKELERFQRLAVGRELKMVELKGELKQFQKTGKDLKEKE